MCTFENQDETTVQCKACETPELGRIADQDARGFADREAMEARDREIEAVKAGEKRRAEETFGFDIYGGKKSSTATLNHLT